jgi:hypothetical protein
MHAQATRERTCLTTVLVIAATVAVVFGCGPELAVSNFRSHYQVRTKVVAIAPLANDSANPEGAAAGQSVREAIFHELITHRDKYTVAIQNIAETDRRIHDFGMSDSSASRLGGLDLCRMTGADAVMKGSVTRYVKLGAGNTFADYSDALFGLVTSEVRVDVGIFDGTDGKLVFQHHIDKSGDLIHEREALLINVGSALAAKFPYKK